MKALITLAHGAGTNMDHPFLVKLSDALAAHGIGTVRFNFRYTEAKQKRPDPPPVAHAVIKGVLTLAREHNEKTPIFAAGKSFGGRMSTQLLASSDIPFVKGIILYGFPLHPAGKPSTERGNHLADINIPMLFLQGSRDALASWPLIKSVCENLPTATLIQIEGADHSFTLKGKDPIAVLSDLSNEWIDQQL